MSERVAADDPEAFRALGRRVVDALADYLSAAHASELPVLPQIAPDELLAHLDAPLAADGAPAARDDRDLLPLIGTLLQHATHVQHPGFLAHQVAVPIPAAVLLEATNALLNNGMASYEMGQAQSIMEHRVVECLADVIGFAGDGAAGGVLTHGGSVGNLTALLAARQAKLGYDVWTEGQRSPLPCVLVSEQAHYCIARAVQVMGWGADGAWTVPVDDRYRLDASALADAHARATAAGRQVIAVVASACSTATGAIDPLEAIADYCSAHGLWLHVDGAHGAALAFSSTHRSRLAGIERADSVVQDLHKLMGLPALNTAVLFRENRRSYEAFAQEASYLFADAAPEEQWFNLGQRTLECTKRGMGATAYCVLRMLGRSWFEDHVDTLLARTRELEALLDAAPDFEVACEPDANILCFRHVDPAVSAGPARSAEQERLRHALIAGGAFYVSQTRLGDDVWLRVTIMNPRSTHAELEGLLAAIRACAAKREPSAP